MTNTELLRLSMKVQIDGAKDILQLAIEENLGLDEVLEEYLQVTKALEQTVNLAIEDEAPKYQDEDNLADSKVETYWDDRKEMRRI